MKLQSPVSPIGFLVRTSLLAVIYCVSLLPNAQAQHTLVIDPDDTVFLDVDTVRGSLQWQISTDGGIWTDLPHRTSDTIKYVPDDFPTYLRLKIIEAGCDPHYSETVTINSSAPSLPVITTIAAKNLGSISAQSGGKVVKTGGSAIVAQGIVYSTSPGPDLVNASSTSDATNTRDFSSVLLGLTPNTTYYIRAYAVNDLGPAYGEELQFTTLPQVSYAVGKTGPAGGIIFYDKGSYSQGWRYLEVAPKGWAGANDPWLDLSWGCEDVLVDQTSTDVGAGRDNTLRIRSAGCAPTGSAVQIISTANTDEYDDWFLPSRDELQLLYTNLFNLGPNFHNTFGFQTKTYTSSSENNKTSAWGYDFAGGGNIQHTKTKAAGFAVRPVRRF